MFARVLLLCAVVIWGWTFVATKILVAELGPIEVFALRLAIGLPFLGGVLLAARVPLVFTHADLGGLPARAHQVDWRGGHRRGHAGHPAAGSPGAVTRWRSPSAYHQDNDYRCSRLLIAR